MAATMTTTTLKYLSPEWRDEAERRLKTELTPETMNRITASMSNIYLECPDGKPRFLVFRFLEGHLTELVLGDSGNPPDAEFRITGTYAVFAAISRAELGAQRALMTGKLKLRGNMIKALRLSSICDRMNKVLSRIPTEY